MANAFISPPMLRLRRSAQSGTKTMTALWGTVYEESSTMAYIFAGAEIDLSPMLAGDVIDVRIQKQLVRAGGWVNHDSVNYAGPRPAGHVTAHINPIPDVYGVRISMRQTAGVLRNIIVETYDAKRLGLA